MSTMNNLEKLIQMATIEQMYLMLEKLKANNTNTNDNTNTNANTYANARAIEIFFHLLTVKV